MVRTCSTNCELINQGLNFEGKRFALCTNGHRHPPTLPKVCQSLRTRDFRSGLRVSRGGLWCSRRWEGSRCPLGFWGGFCQVFWLWGGGSVRNCWLSVHHLEKILSKSTKRPVFLYSAIRRFFCATVPKIRIAMTPMSSTAAPSCFATDRIEDQFMPAMLSRFALRRMPTHAMRLHEWGTRGIGTISCMGHPPYQ
jgi:hypothetical protein